MSTDKINYSMLFGYIENEDPRKIYMKNALNLFPNDLSSTTIKALKIWFGPPAKNPNIRALLGMEVTYLNYQTKEKKRIEYQGQKIEGPDVETGELIMEKNDYLSKIYFNFDENYITYIKFSTKKKYITFGFLPNNKKELENLKQLNLDNNIVLNLKGIASINGIRALGFDYMSYKEFLFVRVAVFVLLRHKIEKVKGYKETFMKKHYNNLNTVMKCVFKLCDLPKLLFQIVIKYF